MKKGFTLIELLAVIVILAIIALIATPIVLNIINDTKESATLRSADFYIDAVELSISQTVLNNKNIKDGTYSVMEDGNICIGILENDTCKEIEDYKGSGYVLEVQVKGEKPNSGTITITNGSINDISLNLGNKVIVKNEKGQLEFEKPRETLVNYIKNLYNETKTATLNGIEYSLDETHLLMNDRLGNSEVAKTDGNIRYYGANPNNYIDIGDRDSEGNIIFWRIIGVFKDIEVTDESGNVIKTENLVKIMRADFLTSGEVNVFSWDYTSAGEYDKNWHDSTLQVMLNDKVNGYYGSGTTNYYNNSTTPVTLNFASTGLSSEVHRKIERVNWSLGSHNSAFIYTDEMYGYEIAGTNKWSGEIALMYPSDFGYSADLSSCQSSLGYSTSSTCQTSNWMYDSNWKNDSTKTQWTLMPHSTVTYSVFHVNANGNVGFVNGGASTAIGVRPVLYLKSDVGIVEEKETSEGLKYLVVE